MERCYVLVDPRTGAPRYIGITKKGLSLRLREHRTAAKCGSDYPVHRWIRSLQRLSLTPQVMLLEVTDDRQRECVWIALFRERGARLLNCTAGGEGMCDPTPETRYKIGCGKRGKKASQETREKLRQSHLGQKPSPETMAKIIAKTKGRKCPPETVARMSAAQQGHPTSPAAREKMRQAKLGKPQPPEIIAKRAAALRGKPRTVPVVHTAESKAKIAAAIRGRKHSPEAIERMKGRQWSPESRARLSAAKTGVKQPPPSQETRAKLSAAHKGKKKSPEHAAKVAAAVKQARDEGRYKQASRLDAAAVVDMRRRYKAGQASAIGLAREYGVGYATAYHAIVGRSWQHVSESPYRTAKAG